MNRVTENLKPERLWYYFEEISKIPRESKNEREVMDYIVNFAEKNKLAYKRDDAGNVVICRPASQGYEGKPVVVLQGHVDMVCEKNEESTHDFAKDPIRLKRDGEWLTAVGTTLGADNGIGVAAMLAFLEDHSIESGKIECLFTVDEETGLNGALDLDPSMLEGRLLLNMDTEEEGVIYIGCAGGRDTNIILPVTQREPGNGMQGLELRIRGLKGGHSGVEINMGRANAIKCMVRTLYRLLEKVPYCIALLQGGDKHNAIPREAMCVIAVEEADLEKAQRLFHESCESMREEYKEVEPDFSFESKRSDLNRNIFDETSTRTALDLLMTIPHGVLSMSPVIKDLVETSTNLASVRTKDSSLRINTSHRSSVESALEWVGDIHRALGDMTNADVEQSKGYPGWNPDPSSPLLKHAQCGIERVVGKKALVKAIHAGLECGVIKAKFPGMDAVSIGAILERAHSPDERVHIRSVERFWSVLLATLDCIYKG